MAAAEMARTFNCGIGMVLAVAPHEAAAVTAALQAAGEQVFAIGRIEAGAKGCEVRGAAGLWGQAEAWTAAHDG
jgi:phosphoribosylformylglycinamidine cyclo-ligase